MKVGMQLISGGVKYTKRLYCKMNLLPDSLGIAFVC